MNAAATRAVSLGSCLLLFYLVGTLHLSVFCCVEKNMAEIQLIKD